jgi:preprotein translocase subunit SecD
MPRRNTITFLIILVIFIFTLWAVLPINGVRFGRHGLRLGLDLVGGVHLVYEGQFSDNATSTEKSNAMERVVLTVKKRIETYGVTEPVIQKLGDDRLLVQLPGFTDIDEAKKLVEQTGFLEFREVEKNSSGAVVTLGDYLSENQTTFIDQKETDSRVFAATDVSGGKAIAIMIKTETGFKFTDVNGNAVDIQTLQKNSTVSSWIPSKGTDGTPLTGDLLSDAQPTLSQGVTGSTPQISIKWNSEGAIIFDQIAARLYDPAGDSGTYNLIHVLGIFLDNNLISAPKVNAQKFEGTGVISGSFTAASAEELANLLKSGALPVQLVKPPLYQEKVSATLGAQFVNNTWKAGLIGTALVMLFMIAYYRLPGLLASLSLIFYGSLTLAIFKLWPAPQITLTLSGLGGFIASIGMAVDANVLIFERMKEEFRTGRTLGAAIEAGFNRAWSSIRDSNITTFIACIILIIVGNLIAAGTPVKWFGVTLFVGVAVSMLTAITVTRTLLRFFIGSKLAEKSWLFTPGGGKKNNV